MNQLDILYRAYLDYRKSTLEDEACAKMRHAIARAAADRDKVESQRSICTIEEDWVCAIEEGLPFVEKAIREERQFIRQRGEVIPIEKVRRVSKASVSHLARHGELITRVPEEGEDLIPDELYMVENLTNYAVYENRFLYMLLCYLRDFIDLRYNKIVELGNTYKANLNMAKTVTIGKRTITYNTQLTDEYRNDPLSTLSTEARDMIRRIEDLQNIVAMLLATPLMKEVAHVPMLKPPVTRTNALKMDNALRKSLALYDYVSSYTKDGYSVDVIRKTYSPLPDAMADDFAETVSLTTFLVYEHSNDLRADLKEAYQQEELRRRDEEAARHRRQLDELRARIAEEGLSPEEYMLRLEERNRYLEGLRTELDQAKDRIAVMTEEQARMAKTIHEQEMKISLHEAEIVALIARHEAEMEETLRIRLAEYTEKIRELSEKYDTDMAAAEARRLSDLDEAEARRSEEIAALDARYDADMTAAQERYDTDMDAADERRLAEIAAVEARREADLATAEAWREAQVAELNNRYDHDVSELNQKYEDCVQTHEITLNELKSDYEEQIGVLGERARKAEADLEDLTEKHIIQRAELRALRHMRGKSSNEEDFTSEERFKELVEELATLDAFIGTHWKRAKRRIRHRYLWSEEET